MDKVDNAFPIASKPLRFSAALLVAGEGPATQQLDLFLPHREQLCWVAADGGMDYAAQYQVSLTAVIGDFDSSQNIENCPAQIIQRFDPAKDETDRNLALNYLVEHGHRHIVQVGGGGGRSDHFLAMVYDYQLQRFPVMPKLWLTRYEAIIYLETGERLELEFQGTAKATALVSSFPLGNNNTVLQSKNLKWPLSELSPQKIDRTLSYSLSNWANAEQVEIFVQQGRVLIFCPYRSETQNPTAFLRRVQIFTPNI